ncbi:MAG: hypothetical protein H6737_22835 [Alphaproteobacteria bacterium]|nr:hypothetical protein [Alphaproteobacteria bacterium]
MDPVARWSLSRVELVTPPRSRLATLATGIAPLLLLAVWLGSAVWMARIEHRPDAALLACERPWSSVRPVCARFEAPWRRVPIARSAWKDTRARMLGCDPARRFPLLARVQPELGIAQPYNGHNGAFFTLAAEVDRTIEAGASPGPLPPLECEDGFRPYWAAEHETRAYERMIRTDYLHRVRAAIAEAHETPAALWWTIAGIVVLGLLGLPFALAHLAWRLRDVRRVALVLEPQRVRFGSRTIASDAIASLGLEGDRIALHRRDGRVLRSSPLPHAAIPEADALCAAFRAEVPGTPAARPPAAIQRLREA